MRSNSTAQLTPFTHEAFGQVRTLVIEGTPYFVAKDIAIALGYSNFRDAILRHCKGVVKHDSPTNSGTQELSFIPQGDVIRLVMRSKLPSAERFESWVCDEVIPTILRTGTYTAPGITHVEENPALPFSVADALARKIDSFQLGQHGSVAVLGRLCDLYRRQRGSDSPTHLGRGQIQRAIFARAAGGPVYQLGATDKYRHRIAYYADLYGQSPRTIKRWTSIGRTAGDPPPLDEPGHMAAWFTRTHRNRVPESLAKFVVHRSR